MLCVCVCVCVLCVCFLFQAEDGIRDLVRSRGLGDVYKRQSLLGQEKYAEAEPWLISGYEGLQQREATLPDYGRPYLLSLIHI